MQMNWRAFTIFAVLLGLLQASVQAQETPVTPGKCIPIQQVTVQDLTPEFAWLQAELGLVGQCLTEENLTAALRRSTNALAARGYVTSRLYVPEQDAAGGNLKLLFIPGRVGEVRVTGGELKAGRVLSLRKGDILNTRTIDQASDQLRRLTSLDAKVLIEPAPEPGVSNLNVVLTRTGKSYHGSVSVGQDDLNRDFVQVTDLPPAAQQLADLPVQVSIDFDNPLKVADMLSLNVVASPGYLLNAGGTFSVGGRYSLPFGKTLVGFGGSYTVNHSLQPGYESVLDYNGRSINLNADLSRVLYRDTLSTATFNQKLSSSLAWSYINDLEILVQRKNTYRAVTGVNYAFNTPEKQVSVGISNALAFNDFLNVPENSGWSDVLQPSLNYTRNFAFQNRAAQYNLNVSGQLSLLGEQYQPFVVDNGIVRGLPSSVYFAGPHALVVQNRLLVRARPAFNPYLTLDAAWASGTAETPSQVAVASTVGAQGRLKSLNYDVRVGVPLNLPEQSRLSFGVQLSWSF